MEAEELYKRNAIVEGIKAKERVGIRTFNKLTANPAGRDKCLKVGGEGLGRRGSEWEEGPAIWVEILVVVLAVGEGE